MCWLAWLRASGGGRAGAAGADGAAGAGADGACGCCDVVTDANVPRLACPAAAALTQLLCMCSMLGCAGSHHTLCCTCCRMGTTGSANSLPGLASSSGRGPAMQSLLLLGRPGSGKTTLLRDIVAQLDQRFGLNVLVVDTSNEIAGGRWPCSMCCCMQVTY
jgi:hypothetical protein